jgi:GAG-pre-integrase domain
VNQAASTFVSNTSPHALLCEKDSAHFWHHRLCHTSEVSIEHLVSTKAFSCKQNKLGKCEACCLAKSHRLLFSSSVTIASQPLEVIHCDV